MTIATITVITKPTTMTTIMITTITIITTMVDRATTTYPGRITFIPICMDTIRTSMRRN